MKRFATQLILTSAACGALAALGLASSNQAAGAAQNDPHVVTGEPLRPLQGSEQGQGAPLQPLATGEASVPLNPAAAQIDWDLVLRAKLTTPDVDRRLTAFDEVARDVSSNAEARAALEAISNDVADADLAFAARLALREADRASNQQRTSRPAPRGRGSLRPGADPFAGPFVGSTVWEILENDPFFNRGRSGTTRGSDPFDAMRREMEAIQKRLDQARGRSLGGSRIFGPGRGGSGQQPFVGGTQLQTSSSMSVEMTPEGIRVKIVEDDGDGPETKTYEAPSREALLEAHPELRDRLR